jgi:hypothetical protein
MMDVSPQYSELRTPDHGDVAEEEDSEVELASAPAVKTPAPRKKGKQRMDVAPPSASEDEGLDERRHERADVWHGSAR